MECLPGLVLHWAGAECSSEIRSSITLDSLCVLPGLLKIASCSSSGKCLAVQQQYNPNEVADLGLQNW